MTQFSLSWDAHKNNICSGLSALQQNGEFVDMTLAADGHHVKVHQMVLSLVSPYIKELIASANCPHPVIFLNKMSYSTLCSILEFIYTGETMVARENLEALIEAAKELHIKGLLDMKLGLSTDILSQSALATINNSEAQPLSKRPAFTNRDEQDRPFKYKESSQNTHSKEAVEIIQNDEEYEDSPNAEADHSLDDVMDSDDDNDKTTSNPSASNLSSAQIVYTLSNQGSLQMILNRCIYNLSYTNKTSDGRRNWRCAAARVNGNWCLAKVYTRNDVVLRRQGVHCHPFHDKRILKKVRDNLVFNAIVDAEVKGSSMKRQRSNNSTTKQTTDADTTDAE